MFKYNLQFFAEDAQVVTDGGSNESVTDTSNTDTQQENVSVNMFTQEQVNDIVSKRLARETEKIRKQFETEYASKVKTGVEEGLSEAEKLKNMTDRERMEYEFNKEKSAFEEEKKKFQLEQLQLTSKSILTDKGYNAEQIDALSKFINFSGTAEDVKESIDAFDKVIREIAKAQTETEINARLQTKTVPKVGTTGCGYTWQDVLSGACTYAEYQQHNKK